VAVADISKRALRHAKKSGIKQTFTDYHQLLKQSAVDAVIIALPTHLHASCAISAAEQGKHVFLEKPIAGNPEEGKKILSAARKNNVKLMVGYPARFKSSYLDLKKRMESGVLGDIQTAHAVNIAAGPFFHRGMSVPRPVPEWWFKKELTGGGALIDLGSHMINLTRWYFGEVNNAKAYLGYRFNFNFEDHAICIVNFKSGTTAIINVGWFSQKQRVGIELFGTVAYASSYQSPPSRLITAVQLLLGRAPQFFTPYLKEVSHFVRCINDDIQPSPSGEDALKDLETITQACKNQIRLG
jgi:UDP-N-acetylglucosamine 3-dehydrogenase